jgi:hypothetical protein
MGRDILGGSSGGGADPTAMHFKGLWVPTDTYAPNDLVIDGDFAWLANETIAPSASGPVALEPVASMAYQPDPTKTALRTPAGVTTFASTARYYGFFDIEVAGTIRLASNFGNQYFGMYKGGTQQPGSVIGQLWEGAVTVGRYFFDVQNAYGGNGTSVTVTELNGAKIATGSPWIKLFAKV